MASETLWLRIRGRVIEYLDLVASAEESLPPLKTADIVNIWEDWVEDMPSPVFPNPPYSGAEAQALSQFAAAWEVFCDGTPDWPCDYAALFAHPAWPAFRDAAGRALSVMMIRGVT